MRAPRRRADSHSSSTTKPAPSPSRKPLRVASNGRLARSGVSLSVDTRRQQAEAGEADRADHRVEAAGQRAVDGAAANELQRRADRLAARRARGVHRRRVAANAEAAREQREARRALAAAEHERVGGGGCRSAAGAASSSPSGAEWRCTSARSSKSTPIMPVPTAQPQRVAVFVRRLDARVAHRLLGGGEREAMRAVRVVQQLARRGDDAARRSPSPRRRCASGSPTRRTA